MNFRTSSAQKANAEERKSFRLASAAKSTILLFLILFPLSFLHLIFHEGGHALVNLIYKIPDISIYVHPFSFSGYSRPISDLAGNAWFHAAGPIAGVLLSLAIFIPLWKRRSVANLFLTMLFPWNLLWEGVTIFAIFMGNGDYYNLIQVTGLPASLFVIIGIILLVVGIFFTISFFPLLGLKPENRNTIWIIPLGMLLWTLPGLAVANWIVPGAPVDVQYNLAGEIIQTANLWIPVMIVLGLILAVIYVTLYRGIYQKLPGSLRTEMKELGWRDLLWPTVWSVISIVIGFIIILL